MAWGQAWTEAQLQGLEPDEHDYQEFKASPFVERNGEVAPGFVLRLSKQVAAFANGHGGRLFIGLDDRGVIDGGVPIDLKGGGMRAWFEDVIPGSVDPPLTSFNVFEVVRGEGPSAILPGHAVYVLEIPSSDAAPHQAQDYRYYLRIAGKSRPMSHVHIEDVSRRTRTPRLAVSRIAPYGAAEPILDDPRGPKVHLCFQAIVANEGRVLAQHAGGEFVLARNLVNSDLRSRLQADGVELTQTPGFLHAFHYHPRPIFPGQELVLLRCWVGLHANNVESVRSGAATIGWRVYADDAPARTGERALNTYGVVRDSVHWLLRHLRERA
jgi:hypothetical protein